MDHGDKNTGTAHKDSASAQKTWVIVGVTLLLVAAVSLGVYQAKSKPATPAGEAHDGAVSGGPPRQGGDMLASINNLKQLSIAVVLYENETGKLPASMQVLHPYLPTHEDITTCPVTGRPYVLMDGLGEIKNWSVIRASDRTLTLHSEPLPGKGGRLVAFYNGSVEPLSEADFQQERERSRNTIAKAANAGR